MNMMQFESISVMRNAIMDLIRKKEHVSFAELRDEIPGFHQSGPGSYTWHCPGVSNVLLWHEMSEEAFGVMRELLNEGIIHAHESGWAYAVDRWKICLPLANPKQSYRRMRWLPVVWCSYPTKGKRMFRDDVLKAMGPPDTQ